MSRRRSSAATPRASTISTWRGSPPPPEIVARSRGSAGRSAPDDQHPHCALTCEYTERVDPRRWARKRGRADDDGPLLTERDQAEIDAIRRQLDAEYGEFGIASALDAQDDTDDERVRPERARRRVVLLVLCIGGLVGAALGSVAYLMRTTPPHVAQP